MGDPLNVTATGGRPTSWVGFDEISMGTPAESRRDEDVDTHAADHDIIRLVLLFSRLINSYSSFCVHYMVAQSYMHMNIGSA